LGAQGSTSLVFPEATLTSLGTDFYIGAAAIDHEVCALNAAVHCDTDLNVAFSSPISNLSFVTSGFDPGDFVNAQIFGAGNVLLGSMAISSNTLVSFGATAGIVRLFLDDSSTGAGLAYDHFSFDQSAAAVPEPATLLLTSLGLGYAGRRRLRHRSTKL
jgi:hypothetical protein